ncbi:MAG: sigma-70 family RNA polymerase sigma factor [Janthinobacterium lividum]
MQDDKLLTQYAQDNSQAAFSQLISRHLTLVYSTCLRELGSPTQAEDAAQVVFLLLARKAKSIHNGLSLAGWLYNTARFVAKDVRKQEARRQRREQAVIQETIHAAESPASEWESIEPLLNSALSSLKPTEREAALLRFIEGHTLAETGALLGLTEDAARMRVTRAVEKMRRYLTAHGAAVTGVLLTALLTSDALRPVPANAAAITHATLQAISTGPAANILLLSKGISHTMKIIKVKYAALAVGVLLAGASVPPLAYALSIHNVGGKVLDAPATMAQTSTQSTGTQTIVLQHVVPTQLLKFLHWDQLTMLPVGVSKIQSLPAQNAIAVTATPAGLAKVQEIIRRLDVEPRQVLIQSGFARVSDAQLKAAGINFADDPRNETRLKPTFVCYTSSVPAVQLLQAQTQPRTVIQAPDITTINNITATVQISETTPLGKEIVQKLTVTPLINSDGTVTLVLHPVLTEGDVKHEVAATRTIKNGSTEIISMPLVAPEAVGENMLFFVTPTIK